MMHVHFDGVRAHGGIPVVKLFFQLAAGQHDARTVGERDEKRVLLGGKENRFAVVENFSGFRFDEESPAFDRGFAAS